MTNEYIKGDVVIYGNQIMVIKEPRDGNHFDLLWHKWVVYSNIDIEDIKPVPLTHEILEKNGWKAGNRDVTFEMEYFDTKLTRVNLFYSIRNICRYDKYEMIYVHQLQHLLFSLGLFRDMEV